MGDRHSIRALSIDGGGIRGYLPALVLAEIEKRAGRPAFDLFDLVVGTSTGGIIGIGMATAMPAAELADFYPRHGARIFGGSNHSGWVKSLGGGMGNSARRFGSVFGGHPEFGGNARYKPDGLESVLAEVLGNTMLSDAVLDLAVTSFDGVSASPVVFSRHDARSNSTLDMPLRDVARATSAAPTFFPPLEVQWAGGTRRFVDGGVWANNPGGLAVAESLRLTGERGMVGTSVYLVSLGTGSGDVQEAFSGISTWIGTAGSTIRTATSVREGELLIERALPPEQISRLQVVDPRIAGAMDDASPGRLNLLKRAAQDLILSRTDEIDRVINRLVG